MSNALKWYAVYTNPRAEKKVAAELGKRGYTYYLPLQKTQKQWSDRKKWVEEPLFKSYLFIYTNLELHYYDILGIQGLVKFIRIGSEIATLRDSQIDDIKLALEQTQDIELSHDKIESGTLVEVIAGPLKGRRGLVLEKSGNKYFSIEIEQLKTTLLLSLPANYLKISG